MTQDIKTHLSDLIRVALQSVAPDQAHTAIVLDRPKQLAHGDFACNLAMQLARSMKRSPRELAQLLLSEIPQSRFVGKTEIAGAGFINFHLLPAAKLEVVRHILAQGQAYGRSMQGGGRKLQIEFVSANSPRRHLPNSKRQSAWATSCASAHRIIGAFLSYADKAPR